MRKYRQCKKYILTSINHVTNCTNGGSTEESRTFLITRTVSGGLYHVNLWEAGSCMVLQKLNLLSQNQNQN